MDPRTYRKHALKLRTRAIYESRPELSASYRSMAKIYDGLAEIAEADRMKRALVQAIKREVLLLPAQPERSDSPR